MNELETALAQTLRDDELNRKAPTAEEIMPGVRTVVAQQRQQHGHRLGRWVGARRWSWPPVLAAGLVAAAVVVAAVAVGPRLLGGDPVDPARSGAVYTGLQDGTPARALADKLQEGTDGLGPWRWGYADLLELEAAGASPAPDDPRLDQLSDVVLAYPVCLLGSPPAPGPVREAGQTLVSPAGAGWEAMAGSLVMEFKDRTAARSNLTALSRGLLRCRGDVGLTQLASRDGSAQGVSTRLSYRVPPGYSQHVWAVRWQDRVAIVGLTVRDTFVVEEQRVFDALADFVRDDVALIPERRRQFTEPD